MRSLIFVLGFVVACKAEVTDNSDTSDTPPEDTSGSADTGDTTPVDTGETEPEEETGQSLFNDHCSGCHAPDGSGTSIGPPILHEVDHHDDAFLVDLILNGRGQMEGVDVTPGQAQLIVDFMRSDSF